MRSFLVKHFALDYTFTVFGWTYNAPRASRIIYPLMVLTGFVAVLNPDYPTPNLLLWILYGLLSIALFFGFVYFRFYPVQWHELDMFQKYQYGIYYEGKLTLKQYEEWLKIRNKL